MLVFAVVALVAPASGCHNYAHTEGWVEVKSRDVHVRTNLAPIYAEPFAERYQRAKDAIAAKEFQCAFDRISEPIDVILLGGVYGDAFVGAELSGVYFRPHEPLVELDPNIVIKSGDEDRDSYLFLHELTHRLIDECVPSAPPWLHEGLATFYETAVLDENELRVGYPSGVFSEREGDFAELSNGDTVELLPLRSAPSFPELRSRDQIEFFDDHANYHAAWVAVHLMKLDSGLAARFRRYMDALAAGDAGEAAWERQFGGTDVDSRYREHLTAEYEFMLYPVSVDDVRAAKIVALSSSEVALLLSTFFDWDDRRSARVARGYIKHAHKEDPSSIEPLLYLASLHAARGRWDKARKPLDAALELDPSNPDVLAAALQLRAMHGRLEELSSAEQRQHDAWAGELTRDGKSSFHHLALSNWFLFRHEADAALVYADRAIELDPRNESAQVAAADAALELGRPEQARLHLKAALGLTDHGARETREDLQSRIDALATAADPPSAM